MVRTGSCGARAWLGWIKAPGTAAVQRRRLGPDPALPRPTQRPDPALPNALTYGLAQRPTQRPNLRPYPTFVARADDDDHDDARDGRHRGECG